MKENTRLELLNTAQKEAVTSESGYVRVIAGAGSGKTRVLTERIVHLLNEGICQPYEILAITFTNKASKEMKERITALIGSQADDIWCLTYHAFCARILRYHIHLLGYENSYPILDTSDQKIILREIYKQYNIKSQDLSYPKVLSKISQFKMQQLSYEEVSKISFLEIDKLIAEVYRDYEKYLRVNKVLDFDSLLLKTLELFEQYPEILERYSHKFKFIHVDEFQDTNDVQFRLVQLLSAHHKQLYIVGDPDQSIYGWRGANDDLILNFDAKFPDVKTIVLEQNYRSTQTILDAANALIQHNAGRLKKNLFSRGIRGDAIHVYEATDEKNEADFVAIRINTLVKTHGEQVLGNIAILYRANYLSRTLEEGLIRHNIPYEIYGDTRFLDRKEIKDMLSYMQLVLNLDDNIAFRRVINEPKRNVGEKTLDKLQLIAQQHEISLFRALEVTATQSGKGKAKQQFMEFKELILQTHERLDELSLVEILDVLYQQSGYEKMLAKDETQQARIENIAELRQSLQEYQQKFSEETTRTVLSNYLQELALLSSSDKEQNPYTVSLMTVHAAKGLEFEVVFLIGVNSNIFPSRRSVEEGGMDEERRLAYVALTRAKKKLYVSFANGMDMMSRERKKASDFLYEAKLLAQRSNPMFEQTPKFVQKPKANKPLAMNFRETVDESSFGVGEKVRHKKFGEGVVVAIDDKMITVAFAAEFGIKTLVANFIEKL